MLVQLVTAKGKKFEEGYLVEVLRAFPEVRSIHWAINDTPAEVTNLPTVLLWGEDAIEEEILGLRFRVRPNAFLQTNTEMAETLYSLARDFAGLTGGETVYDLYCGTGTIGLALASQALTVWGVEISEESVACAIENAELNEITNAAFFAGNVSLALEELLERAGPPDVVVVDPPRAGLAGKALRRMARLQAPRIVYVSCNPTTLASDLKALREDFGYELRRCVPVDMFPHTPHIESVNLLELVEPLEPAALSLASLRASRPRSRQRPRAGRRSAAGTRARSRAARAGRRCRTPLVRISVSAEQADHRARSTSADPQPEAGGGREEQREEEDVRRPDVRRAVSPGSRNAIEMRVEQLGCSRRRSFVGPRQTESASTHGMMTATSTTHESASKSLQEPEAERGQGAELRDVEERAEPGEWKSDGREHANADAASSDRAAARERQHEPRHREDGREERRRR